MGEVYRATDTRLDRTVAVKVLPASVAGNTSLRERFEREARAVAALNHPNICTLHDVGRQRPSIAGAEAEAGTGAAEPGEASAPVDFLVMEYLDGESLSQRLERGGLRQDEALRIAGEIAAGLDAAHRQGIIHRDLKPANIMLTPTGVKLLDFGLARLRETAGADEALDAPTRAALTTEGTILGTLQYMAPEQLDGKPADARSDVYAFGATLYEMVAGARAFDGESQASIIGSILRDEPTSLREVRPGLPRGLDRLVRTCLAKDPDDRWQTVRDLKRELRWIAQADEPDDATVTTSAPAGGTPARPGWRLAVGMLAPALVAATAAWMLKPVPEPPAATVQRFVIAAGEGQELTGVLEVSPDGRRLVYGVGEAGTTRLYVRALDAYEPTPVAGTDGMAVTTAFFSTDGEHVAFGSQDDARWTLRRVPLAGGDPLEVASGDGRIFGGTWREDDSLVLGMVGGGLVQVPAGGGEPLSLTRLDAGRGDLAHVGPFVLADRDDVFFAIVSGTEDDQVVQMAVLQPDGGVRVVLEQTLGGEYVETGHLVYALPGLEFVARRFDLDTLAFEGDPIPLTGLLDRWYTQDVNSLVDIAAAGDTRAFIRRSDEGLQTLTWVDRGGNEDPLPLDPAVYRIARVSPDGGRIALDRGLPGERDLWIFDLARETLSPLFRNGGDNEYPAWTPDGRRIVFTSGQEPDNTLHLRAADGTGPVERLAASAELHWAQSWSPDGRTLVFVSRAASGGSLDLRMMTLDDDRTIAPLLASGFNESNAAVSPDGRWLAYRSDESGRDEVYVQRFPELGGRVQISTDGGTGPLWSPDGTELFYREGPAMMAVAVDGSGPAFSAGRPVRLFEGRYLDDLARNYDLAPDGRFLMIKLAETLDQIHVLVNGNEELRPFLSAN